MPRFSQSVSLVGDVKCIPAWTIRGCRDTARQIQQGEVLMTIADEQDNELSE
jgi:hypothetical protein